MKPGGLESLRGIQAALAEFIMPELTTLYAQDIGQTLAMLIESIAAEVDSAAEDLVSSNRSVRDLLSKAISVLSSGAEGNEPPATLVKQIEDAVAIPAAPTLRISELTLESEALRGVLERVAVELEDIAADQKDPPAMALREAIYSHLRVGAAAGWSFWDVASFRERMAALKSDIRR